jgi:hypothetical protein
MKRSLALVAVLALAVAAPAAGKKKTTKVKITSWTVTTGDGKSHSLKNGKTFTHCDTNIVTRLGASGKMTNPSKKGVKFSVSWLHDGKLAQSQDGKTKKGGKVKLSLAGGGAPLAEGPCAGSAPLIAATGRLRSGAAAPRSPTRRAPRRRPRSGWAGWCSARSG